MKCERQKPQTYWTNFGKRAASMGHTLEWTVDPLKPSATAVKQWITEGYLAQQRKMEKSK